MSKRDFVTELHAKMCLPAIVAPMFLISGPDIVIAAAKAGIIGCFPAPNARTIDDLKLWLAKIDNALNGTVNEGMWGINMIVHKTYDRFDEEMALIERHKPKFVVTALGNPKRVLDRVHAFGGKVLADVITVEQAQKAVAAGVDGLILVCSGAGGHTGHYSAFSFVEEVRRFYDGPLIVGGAIQNARSIQALLALGADFAYMGTRFIGCKESLVSDEYRDMLVRTNMGDIVTTDVVSGVKANWIRESMDRAGLSEHSEAESKEISFANLHGESKAWKHVWGAGHGVGATQKIETVQEIVDDMVQDFMITKNQFQASLNAWPGIRQ